MHEWEFYLYGVGYMPRKRDEIIEECRGNKQGKSIKLKKVKYK